MKTGHSKIIWKFVLGLLLFAPVLAIVLSLYGAHGMFFWDAKTIPCGIQSALQSGNPNAYLNNPSYQGACAGYGYGYMLPPGITAFLTGFAQFFGLNVLKVGYFIFYALALSLLGWGALRYGASRIELLLFVIFLGCGVFVFDFGGGNVSIVFTSLIFGLILTAKSNRHWVNCSVLLCVAASAVKPPFALYLLVPLFAGRAGLTVAGAAAAILLGYVLDATLQPAQFNQWLNLIIPVVYGEPHFGVMRLMQWAGLGAGDWLTQGGGYLLWCMAVMGLLWSGRSRLLTAQDRGLAALLAVTLMLPRLKEYDTVVLIPLFFWLRGRLAQPLQTLFVRLTFATVFFLPALWWWLRKALLLTDSHRLTLTQIADPRWVIATQGFFLATLLLLMFSFLVWPDRTSSALRKA